MPFSRHNSIYSLTPTWKSTTPTNADPYVCTTLFFAETEYFAMISQWFQTIQKCGHSQTIAGGFSDYTKTKAGLFNTKWTPWTAVQTETRTARRRRAESCDIASSQTASVCLLHLQVFLKKDVKEFEGSMQLVSALWIARSSGSGCWADSTRAKCEKGTRD